MPGQITFTRIRSFASSSASIFASATCPAFEAEYAVAPVFEKIRVPFTDEVTITDPPVRFMTGTAYLIVRNVPRRFVLMVRSQSPGFELLDRRPDAVDARVRKEHVEPAPLRVDRVRRVAHLARVRDVGDERHGHAARVVDLGDHRVDLVGRMAERGHLRPLPCEEEGRRPADAGAGAGHERDPPVELVHRIRLMSGSSPP